MADDLLDGSAPKEASDDQEIEINPFDAPTLDTKVTTGEKYTSVKKEGTTPAKRPRSQVDRIADAEMARLDCKKAKFGVEQERLKSVRSVAMAKAQERTHRVVEVRQAELDLERERMRMDHKYRMEMLKLGLTPSAAPFPQGFQPYSATWPNSQSYIAPQPSMTPIKEPQLQGFSPPPLEVGSSSHHRSSPQLRPDLFNENGC